MLKRSFLLASLFLFIFRVWSQSITITPTGPVAICQGDSVKLVAHVTGGGYGTDSYSFQQITPFHAETFVGDTVVDTLFRSNTGSFTSNHDDTWAGPFPIGFQFCFLNHIYTQYWIGSNGWIGFTNPLNQGWTTYTPFTLPSTNSNVPKNAIFGPYQDWYPTRDYDNTGQYNVFRHIISNPPNSKLVIYWNNCPMYGSDYKPDGSNAKGTFQIVLSQQSCTIENNITLKPYCSWQSNDATQGVHNADGTGAYIAFSRNQNSWTTSNESTRFVPSGISWYKDSYPGGTMAGHGDSIYVKPSATCTYFAVLNTCSSGTATASKLITVNPRPVPTLTGKTSVCHNNTEKYTTESGKTNYIWSVVHGCIVSGGTATSDSVKVKWDNLTGPQTVNVSYTNAYGCAPTTATVLNVTVNTFIAPVITGVSSICLGGQATFTTQSGNTNYLWTYPGATKISGGTTSNNTITLAFPVSGTIDISVNYTGPGGCTSASPTTKCIVVNPTPVPTMTGPVASCIGSTCTYSTDAGMTGYIWTVSSGGTIVSGQNSASVVVAWNVQGSQSVNVNYTNSNGCSTSNPPQYNVTVIALPVPAITGNNSVCKGIAGNVYCTQAGMTGYSWTVTPDGTITSGSGTNSIQVTWSTCGTKTVSVNYINAGGCTALSPALFNVVVHDLPAPTLSGNTSICAGSIGNTYTTQPGMNNYSWAVSSGGTITAGGTTTDNSVTVTWNTPGAQSVSVGYNNINGCTSAAPAVYPVTVNQVPAPTITGNNNLCAGTTGVIYSTQPGMNNYSWSVSIGGTITAGGTTTDNTVTVTWNTAGAQTVSVGYNNINGCTAAPAVYPVTVNTVPSPIITGINNLCVGTTSFTYTTQAGMNNYSWSVSTGATITAGGTTTDNTVTVTWNTPGAQSVSVNYINTNGCTGASSTVYPVAVNQVPAPTITGNNNLCAGTTGFIYTTQAGMNNYSWSVSAGGTITAGGTTTDNTVTVTWNTAGAQSVSVGYNNINGCTAAPAVYPVTVNQVPAPTITGNNNLCAGNTGVIYSTQPGMNNYSWSVSSGGTITAGGTTTDNSVTVTWNTAGAHSVTVGYNNINGCTAAPAVYPVTVNQVPAPTITGSNNLCAGNTGVIYSTQPGMNNYSWSVSSGGTITAGGTTTDNTVTVTWNTPGAQSVSVNYNNTNGCTGASSTVYPVAVNQVPAPTITGNNNLCAGTTGFIYTTQAGMNNYSWSVSAGGTITAGGTTTDNTVTVTWNTAGAQSVSVGYNNINGCTAAPAVYPVTVNQVPAPTITGNNNICVGTTGVIYSTQPGMNNYSWSASAGGTITAGGTTTDNTVTVTWNTAGAQSVSVNYSNSYGCTATSSTVYPVTVNQIPAVTITGSNNLCVGTTGITYTTQSGMSNYQWSVSAGGTITAGGTSADNSVTVTWNTAGAQSVSVNYSNSNGCTGTSSTVYPVTVNQVPAPTITGNNNLCAGTTGFIYSTQPGMNTYSWSVSSGGTITGGGTITDNIVTVTWNTAGAQSVSVNYNNTNGCTGASSTVYPVAVNQVPAPTITGNNNLCAGTTGFIYTTQAGMNNYSWSVSGGGTITAGGTTTDNSVTITWNIPGAQSVSVNYNNANGCTATTSTVYPVTVNTVSSPTITGNNNLCVGTTGFIYSTQPGMNNYSWSVSGGGTITAGGTTIDNSVTVTWNTPGVQSVSVNYSNSYGCTAASSTVFPVTVNQVPAPTITGNNNLCVGTTGVIYSAQTGMNNYLWSVSGGGTITAGGNTTDNTVSVTWNTAGAQSVSVNYNNANGCTATTSTVYPVTVNPLPVPVITGPAALCMNSAGTYSTASGMTNYSWTVSPDGTIISGAGSSIINVMWPTNGNKTMTVNYLDVNGCASATATSFSLTVSNLPVPSLTGIDTICSGTQQIYTTDPGMTGYTWLVSSGGTVTAGGTATDHTITILWNASGTQSISVNYQAGPGCTALLPTVLDVTIKPRPSIINASNSSVCSGTSINIIPESNLPGSSFSWTATGSSGNVSGFHSGNGSSITDSLINTGFGNESVTYAVIPSMNGCDGNPSNYSVAVSPVADVYFTPAGQSLCSGGVTGIVLASHANGANFTWTASGSSGNVSGFGPGNGSSIVQNLINSGYNNETVNYDVMSAVNGCPGLAGNVLVTVSPIPAVTFTTCNDITTTTNARPILLKGGLPLSGTYSGTGVNSGIFYPSQATPGTDTIHYSYVNVYGCSNSAFITITVLSDVTFSCESNFTDVRDNTIYQTIKIGTQCWMNSNLNFGVVLPASSLQRDNCVVDKYCYNDTDSTCSTYGALYEWDELMNYTTTEGTQGLCPPSWHVPSESEWNTLFDYYISNGYAGNPLKSSGSSGFNAQLRGALFNDLNWDFNNFATFFWSSTAHGPAKAWAHAMNTNNPSVSFYPSIRTNAFPVRCLKD